MDQALQRQASTTLQTQLFDAFRRLAYREAGIAVRENKGPLLAARLAQRVHDLGLANASEYLSHLQANRGGAEMAHFLDALTTQYTRFFREPEQLAKVTEAAAAWAESSAGQVRIWCASAGTGEEPYTLAMILAEALAPSGTDFRILATDISTRALAFAKHGCYPRSRLAQVPPALQARYFEPIGSLRGADVRVVAELRERVVFKRMNLAAPPFPLRSGLDAVLCRNVLLYFDSAVQQRVLAEMQRLLKPDGILVGAP